MNFEELLEPTRLITFFFVFIRINAIIFTAPIFSSTVLNNQLRIMLSTIIALLVAPNIPRLMVVDPSALWLILTASKEILIGITIGVMTSLLFSAVQFGGYLVDYQMGFSMVSVLDPSSNASMSFSGQVYNILATLIYLSIYGHHIFLRAIMTSFDYLPLANFPYNQEALLFVLLTFTRVFVVALQITAPVFIALMVTNAVMGFMARLVPQINLMVIGFPIKIGIGAIFLTLGLPLFYVVFEKIMNEYFRTILSFFDKMAGQ